MAWNQSTGPAKVEPKKPSALKGVVAGVACVAIAAAVAFFVMSGKDEKPKAKVEKEQGLIKEVKPAAAPKVEPVGTNTTKKSKRIWDPQSDEGLSPVVARIWRYNKNPPSWTNTTSLTQAKPRYAIFPTAIENELACLLTMRPGEALVGTRIYGKDLAEKFIKSCETPIVISDDDTPEQKQLKKDMIQTKIDLRQRMADGEDLAKILTDAHAENRRLAGIKREIESQMRDLIKNEAKSEAEVDDLIAAANKMLDEKGIAPLSMNPVTRRNFLRMVKRNNAKTAAGRK